MLLLSRFVISGHSMEPTLWHGQTVLASSIPFLFSKPKTGDIVVVKIEHKNRHSGNPSADGASRIFSSPDPRLSRRRAPSSAPSPLGRGDGVRVSSQNDEGDKVFIKRITKIGGEKYFVRGDNKKDSFDSRKFGWITKANIMGKVVSIVKNVSRTYA